MTDFHTILAARKRMMRDKCPYRRAARWLVARVFGGLLILFAFAVCVPGCVLLRQKQPNGKDSA